MKQHLLILFAQLLICSAGIAQNFQWVKTIGSINEDLITGIAASNDGHVYVLGNFQDTIDLDNGPGVYPLISEVLNYYEGQSSSAGSGGRQIFLAKYTSDGQIVWGKQYGGYYEDFGGIIKLDHEGNIVITGSYYYTIDFNLTDTLNAWGLSNAQNTFIAKISSDGDLIWDRRYEDGPYIPELNYNLTLFTINDIDFNADNSMIICGQTAGQLNVYLNTELEQNVINAGNTVFYQKLNSNGNCEYLKFIKGSSTTLFSSNINAVSINQQGDFTIAGNYSDSLWINPEDSTYFIDLDSLSVLSTYGFFAHYAADGVFLWSKSIIGGSALYNRDMVIDAYGNHYIAGEFAQPPGFNDTRPAIDFDPGPGQYNVPTETIGSTTSSAFLASYTPSGDFRWAFWMVSPYASTYLNGSVQGNFLELDAAERLILGGSLRSIILDIDPGPNVVSLQSEQTGINGLASPFIARYTTNGNYISHKQFRGAGTCWQTSLSLDTNASIYTSGIFLGNCKFNYPNSLVTTSTNYFNYNFPNDFSLAQDGFFTKHQNCIQKTYINQTICSGDSISYNGYSLKKSGRYPRFLSTINGCDLVEVLNLHVTPPVEVTQTIAICKGESFTIGNQSLSESGVYETVFLAQNGCDSLVTTNLVVDTLTAEISLSDNVFTTLNPPVNATFQWLNCDANYSSITGALNPQFTAIVDGTYALEITSDNCRDTSECLLFSSVNITPLNSNEFILYPNPTQGLVFIESGNINIPVRLYDAQGKLVYETIKQEKRLELEINTFPNGIYFIQFGTFSQRFSIIKN
jgi:hypothetical protein